MEGRGTDKKKRQGGRERRGKGRKCARKMPEGSVRGLAQNNIMFISGHTDPFLKWRQTTLKCYQGNSKKPPRCTQMHYIANVI